MLLIALWTLLVVQVLSETPPAPPLKIHVDKWMLKWTPATEERNVLYTVQYSRFESEEWTDVRACVRVAYNSCDVSFTKNEGEHGCVKLRVLAERRGLQSVPVEACNRQNDQCTPEVLLTARPGSLTVHLSKNHTLAYHYGGHAIHRIYYSREGDPYEETKDTDASLSIDELAVGQRYCVKVQYIYFSNPVGLPSCTQCVLIPEPEKEKPTQVFVGVAIVLFLVILVPAIVYVLLFQQERLKHFLQPPVQIPDHFFLERHHRYPNINQSCREERHDMISSISSI